MLLFVNWKFPTEKLATKNNLLPRWLVRYSTRTERFDISLTQLNLKLGKSYNLNHKDVK